MDFPRPNARRNKRIVLTITLTFAIAGVTAAIHAFSKLQPAAPVVDRATVWFGTVKRGSMLREIHGVGTLVPEEFRWIPVEPDGLIEQIHVRVGDVVTSETILMVLSNPELERSVVDTEYDIRAALADVANLRSQLQTQVLNQQASQASADAAALRARLHADADQELARDGLKSALDVKLSRLDSENASAQVELERKRGEVNTEAAETQIAAREAQVEKLRAALVFKKAQVAGLRVRAGAAGVLQEWSAGVERGRRIAAGAVVAKLAQPGRLKAQLKIAEALASDVAIGQVAAIDLRDRSNGIVPGRVVHIDPAAAGGSVTIDVQFQGPLPKGARPDLGVDGTVEIERLSDVLYVGRPSQTQSDVWLSMFKLMPGGQAVRTQVKLGRISVSSVEVREGLVEGDQIILSDMSRWSNVDQLRIQ